jgi:glucose/arabinose dehydrogenase
MHTLAIAAGLIAGLIHVYFWVFEVFLFRKPKVHGTFGLRGLDHAAVARPAFFNLGFYNLFLAVGAFVGVWMLATERGAGVLAFTMAFMLAAALVLLASSRGSLRGPLLQGLAPAIALTALIASPATLTPPLQPSAAPSSLPQITATADVPNESPTAPEVIGGVESVVITSREDVVTGLQVPWAMAFTQDGALLVTERTTARVLRISNGEVAPLTGPGADALAEFAGAPSEGGLLGIALLPSDPHTVYLYQTRGRVNEVLRMTLSGNELTDPSVIFTGIPAAGVHNGGRIAFGPDGFLYVATGDSASGNLAQNVDSLAGKILRIVADGTAADGTPAPGNPWNTAVWSIGHRNVQGLAFVADGRLYASEFGQQDVDELNLIQPGANYGWPTVEGLNGAPAGTALGDTVDGLTYPVAEWRPTSAGSPSGAAATMEGIYIAGLRGNALFRVPLTGNGVGAPQRLIEDLGRVRDVIVGPDGALYIATNNTDGRGDPRDGDDRIVRVEVAPA